MLLKFTVQATAFSTSSVASKANGMRQFPANVINRVIVCNRDGCSYQHITNVKNGKFDVDFELAPVEKGAVLCDTLKFHFYSGNAVPIVVAAGSVPMKSIIQLVEGKSCLATTFRCNFVPVQVMVQCTPPSTPIVGQALPAMEKSALWKTPKAIQIFNATAVGLSQVISESLNLERTCGAPMFCNLLTAHNMQDQATTHAHFQSDVEPTAEDTKRFFKTGLTMTALTEALHSSCLTPADVLKMNSHDDSFSLFVSAVCQSFMRSAHICPYVPDKVVSPELDAAGQVRHIGSESFKLPFREPFLSGPKCAGFLNADDCEGHATFMLHLFRSFQHMYERYNGTSDKLDTVFPANLFQMTQAEKQEHWDLAMHIGKLASQGALHCDIVLISAGSAALGDGGDNIGGHATCVLVNETGAVPREFLMEGTNSMTWDDDSRTVNLIKAGLIPVQMELVHVANLLTQNIQNIAGEPNEHDSRKVMHINKKLEKGFYKTAFCQNGRLLASKSAPTLSYGINMDHISDYTMKVIMPVSAEFINKVTKNKKSSNFLDAHRAARSSEIHPPRAPLSKIEDALKPWTAIQAYKKHSCLEGRQYKVCLTMRSIRDPAERTAVHNTLAAKLEEWNKKFSSLGHCSAYVAFDTVFTRLCMWTDDIPKLQETLSCAMK